MRIVLHSQPLKALLPLGYRISQSYLFYTVQYK